MSKILIENYRGFDIEFDTQYEKFQCIITEENTKESNSFSPVKKFIDEYKKQNKDFIPFSVIPTPTSYKNGGGINIIGIRKDGRFIGENSKGEKIQIPNYDESDYMLSNEPNKEHLNRLLELKKEKEEYDAKYKESWKEVVSKINITTLKEYKNNIK